MPPGPSEARAASRRSYHRFFPELKPEELGRGPKIVELILMSNSCNQACVMCPLSLPNPPKRDMDRGVIDAVLDGIEEADAVVELVAWGETLLASNFDYALERTLSKGLKALVVTNGLLVDRSPVLREAVRRGRVALRFSLDAATEGTYKRLRPVRSSRPAHPFERVLDNIRLCARLRQASGSDRALLAASFVLMRSNVEEFPDFMKLCASLGVDFVYAMHVVAASPTDPRESLAHEPALSDALCSRALDSMFKLGLPMSPRMVRQLFFDPTLAKRYARAAWFYDGGAEKMARGAAPVLPTPFCIKPWTFTRVEWDGTVRPCCTAGNLGVGFGSVRDRPLRRIWAEPAYAGLRRAIKDGRRGPLCAACRVDETGAPGSPAAHFLKRP